MKIEAHKTPESRGSGAQYVKQAATTDPKDAVAEVKKAKPYDKLDISSKSRELADILSAVNQLPDVFREARVTELKRCVEAGTYTVYPGKVAEKILKELYS